MASDTTRIPSIYILSQSDERDPAITASCARLGLQTRYFSQPANFLSVSLNNLPDCLMIDLDGFTPATEFLSELLRCGCRSVVIAIASDLNVDTAIQLMESGILSLLKKPLQANRLENYLRRALELSNQEREFHAAHASFSEKQSSLTSRQCAILWSVVDGLPTKAIAAKLDVSNRLVELERARLLKIFESESTTELAFKVGQFLTLERTIAHHYQPHFSRLRVAAESKRHQPPDD